eukprot:GCRY01002575.1.p1 GENE.GCRY01002575.1~~GCRY01002575.1.p1  ORF type:complete len:360 (+),score=13.01 GCRY01002575.1:166-1245(+)
MNSHSDRNSVIIDHGCYYTKIGFSGEHSPVSILPTVASHVRSKEGPQAGSALLEESPAAFSFPIQRGNIESWEDMEKIWHHIFDVELFFEPKEHNILLSEPIFNPIETREKLAEYMFELFGFSGFFLKNQPVLSLFSTGRSTGLVAEIGDGLTQICPVYEGFMLKHLTQRINRGGRDVTAALQSTLSGADHYSLSTVREIKERLALVNINKDQSDQDLLQLFEDFSTSSSQYKLPDGQLLDIQPPRVQELMEQIVSPLAGEIKTILNQLDLGIQPVLTSNIVITGGSTLAKRFPERVRTDLQGMIPKFSKKMVTAPAERDISVFLGASILTSLPNFASQWVSKSDYDEQGSLLLKQRCL